MRVTWRRPELPQPRTGRLTGGFGVIVSVVHLVGRPRLATLGSLPAIAPEAPAAERRRTTRAPALHRRGAAHDPTSIVTRLGSRAPDGGHRRSSRGRAAPLDQSPAPCRADADAIGREGAVMMALIVVGIGVATALSIYSVVRGGIRARR